MKKKFIILLSILDVLAVMCLLLAYGPYSGFRDWLIGTAMTSWHHKYFAQTIYTEKQIDAFLAKRDNVEEKPQKEYEQFNSYYDEQILTRNEDDVYKIIELDEKDYKGHILVVYDPSRITLEVAKVNWGQKISEFAESYEALAAVNASGFGRDGKNNLYMNRTFIHNGNLIKDYGGEIVGFNEKHELILVSGDATKAIQNGMIDGVSFGPFLVIDGEPRVFNNGGGYGLRPRTAIGQREDGIVLFVVIDGNEYGTEGIDMEDLTNIFVKYGCINASNLDGGGSSSLYADGKLINNPAGWGYSGERYLPNAWIIK